MRLVNNANAEKLNVETAFAWQCLCLSLVSSVVLEKLLIGNRFLMLFEGLAHCHIQASFDRSCICELFFFSFHEEIEDHGT